MTTDIFAPKELSQKLREIGFDEPCIAIYSIHDNELKSIIQGEEKLIDNFILGKFTCSSYSGIPAPTWEQVFKWFRGKGIYSEIMITNLGFRGNIITCDKEGVKEGSYLKVKETYEQCREALALELIEIYKKRTKQ